MSNLIIGVAVALAVGLGLMTTYALNQAEEAGRLSNVVTEFQDTNERLNQEIAKGIEERKRTDGVLLDNKKKQNDLTIANSALVKELRDAQKKLRESNPCVVTDMPDEYYRLFVGDREAGDAGGEGVPADAADRRHAGASTER